MRSIRKGNHKVVAVNGAGDNKYWLWEGQGQRLAAGRTDRDHPRHRAADHDNALHQRAVIAARR